MELQIHKNAELGSVRTTVINDEPYFVGKDVAEILGYSNPQKALRDHVDEEDKTVNESFTVNGTMGILINESGLYSLILSSKMPNAKKFKRDVCHR
ncbi:Bro-N domain-containing protein [Anaerostipes faecis]|uniref:BRO-N domain-containing protein n=1 Tax=Anaerostipes faecis TaxID=2880702 RepID=UPI0026DA6BB2